MANVNIKRIYDPYSKADGYRILIDRLWPRGIKKENAHIDKWLKEVAPSTELRKQFNHQPEKWGHFIPAYLSELNSSSAVKELLSDINSYHTVTLLFAAGDTEHNHALVLQQFVNQHL
ncbi:DUF488 domain-containing protein [Mucilaginibacter ginsenosidivorans]|uniref:DUF488 domain-containing protein n=1 Tax=Mucilaginibacter ginsenosidivorans TaxID=398053 RepID=A0A5B8V019_9SPHI|nr:DUF488 domain-containing protein [Mucilaginibacter ginsenosidivorans]QEC64684.1 DUF488 domain-containing protein [Mucilaginibacter ginsenosidivorans]